MVIVIEITMIEVEHVEEIANGRHVDGDIRTIIIHPRIGKIVAAALAEFAEGPVTLTPAGSGADYYNVVPIAQSACRVRHMKTPAKMGQNQPKNEREFNYNK